MAGDNFQINIVSEGRKHFDAGVSMIFANCPGGKATHYVSPIPAGPCLKCSGTGKHWHWREKQSFEFPCDKCDGTGRAAQQNGFVLLWHQDSVRSNDATPLPFPLDALGAANFLWDWLQSTEFPEEPDHDGSNERGYILTSGDFWGHVEGSHYAFLGLYPDWQMYGK